MLHLLRALLALLGVGAAPTLAFRLGHRPTLRACMPIPRAVLCFAAPPRPPEPAPAAPTPIAPRRFGPPARPAPPAWLLAPPAALSHASPPLLERGRCAIARWLVFDSPPDGRAA